MNSRRLSRSSAPRGLGSKLMGLNLTAPIGTATGSTRTRPAREGDV